MSYYHDHDHTTESRHQFRTGVTPKRYGAVVGTIDTNTEKPIQGRSGDHLQFYVEVGNNTRYQVDVNTQSEDGTAIQLYVAVQDLPSAGSNADEPFGAPAYGVFPDAKLSYEAIGLTDEDFIAVPDFRLDSKLEAALNQAEFVSVYGQTFDDGGPTGKGIHETHFTGKPNQDGAIAVYQIDSATNAPKRTWFYFKFQNDKI
jgi:hypothetical protein